MKKIILLLIVAISLFTGCATMTSLTQAAAGPIIKTPNANLKVELQKCERTGNDVVVEFLLKNTGPETGYVLSSNPYRGPDSFGEAIDNLGNKYEPKFGGYWAAERTLSTNVPVKIQVTISDVAPNATSLSMLQFTGQIQSREGAVMNQIRQGQFEFRNLSIK